MWSRARRPGRWAESGTTLLELLVVFAISSTALLLAGRLLLEAQSRSVHEARRTLEPVADLAIDQLRADLRLADGVVKPLFGGWERGPLVLVGHPAGRLSYDKLGERLLRRVERDGELVGERPVLENVTTWRWRLRGDGAVDVELGYRELGRLRTLRQGGDWQEETWVDRHRTLRVMPRGSGEARW